MSDDGPPLKFVAIWGVFALLMLFGQIQMIDHGVKISLPYQTDLPGDPVQFASLD